MRWTAGVALAALMLSGCSSDQRDRAQSAYDECSRGDGPTVLRLDRTAVHIEVLGKGAEAVESLTSEDIATMLSGERVAHADETRAYQMQLRWMGSVFCMVEQTGYPDRTLDLRPGDEWDGWRYEEPRSTGSDIRMTFVATR